MRVQLKIATKSTKITRKIALLRDPTITALLSPGHAALGAIYAMTGTIERKPHLRK